MIGGHVELLRTPEERFADLEGFDYEPSYVEVPLDDLPVGGLGPHGPRGLRVAYVDVGPSDGDPILALHGEPTWSYLYRHVIAVLVEAGHRVVAPDLVGFGRSDKPTEVADHTYARHIAWMTAAVEQLDLRRATLLCQDWGGLIGLRILAAQPDRFARAVLANTGLPIGSSRMPDAWQAFRDVVASADHLDVGRIVASGCLRGLEPTARAAYDAPFPDESFKAGARAMPGLVPQSAHDPEARPNRAAWATLSRLDLPVLVAFSDSDPITAPARRSFVERLAGAQGREHPTIQRAGHFLQEDAGPELAQAVDAFVRSTPAPG